uniref:Mitochondrial import inner membrane translocase subunit n=1 Tax=Mastacembelus armatus TaxID=205130 RepID=A0A7N8YBM2_9TELE
PFCCSSLSHISKTQCEVLLKYYYFIITDLFYYSTCSLLVCCESALPFLPELTCPSAAARSIFSPDEQSSCSESCLQKYLKMTQRISMRFQEYHIQQNEALAAKAGLLGQPR